MKDVLFYFDFGSPNAYLSHRVIPDIEARTGARFDYVPALLGGIFKLTGNRSPAEAFSGIKNKMEYEQRETQRFVARHGLSAYRMNPHFPVNTLKIMRGAVAAQREGVFEAYVETVFKAMWEQGLKMDDVEVIGEALEAAGLDAPSIMARAEEAESWFGGHRATPPGPPAPPPETTGVTEPPGMPPPATEPPAPQPPVSPPL